MNDFSLRRYTAADQKIWDEFVLRAEKTHFMFLRHYMDYHADRFPDASFIGEYKGRIIGLFPGTLSAKGVWSSHAGLTFGGLLSESDLGTSKTLTLFSLLDHALRAAGAHSVIYKPVPWIYGHTPHEEDLYALFRARASLTARQISLALQPGTQTMEARRLRGVRRACNQGAMVEESTDFIEFWNLLSLCLAERHGAVPVHSASELELLAYRFPQHIRLFITRIKGECVAGTLLFLNDRVVHTQYLATSTSGREIGALDFLLHHLLSTDWIQGRFFDFGTSCLESGLILNEGLAAQKEGFGGRGIVYDTYEYRL